MEAPLRDLPVLVLDCQSSGATPAHGDLLEIGWATCDARGLTSDVHARWVLPTSDRPISRAVRQLTGWDETCLPASVPPRVASAELERFIRMTTREGARMPTAIHFARFELPFLGALFAGAELPLDVACVHAIAQRLHPELPRKSLRALAGHLGHPAELARRVRGHVEATAFVWKTFVPVLAARGIETWGELAAWLETERVPKRPKKRTFTFAPSRRRSLPRAPGVYEFVRASGDVLYVGKAADLRKRVASHFTSAARATERALEMLTQVSDVRVTETATALEAALLECDEIKRVEPPYNVQLRADGRATWFASVDLASVAPSMDARHRVGPLPSEHAVAPLVAMRSLAEGAARTRELRARALGVSPRWAPDDALFDEGYARFADKYLGARPRTTPAWLKLAASIREDLALADDAEDADAEDAGPAEGWDVDSVARQLADGLVASALVVERARRIRLLADSTVVFRERGRQAARAVVVRGGGIVHRFDVEQPDAEPEGEPHGTSAAGPAPRFDIAAYDRLRVLATELARLRAEGAAIHVHVRRHRARIA